MPNSRPRPPAVEQASSLDGQGGTNCRTLLDYSVCRENSGNCWLGVTDLRPLLAAEQPESDNDV